MVRPFCLSVVLQNRGDNSGYSLDFYLYFSLSLENTGDYNGYSRDFTLYF